MQSGVEMKNESERKGEMDKGEGKGKTIIKTLGAELCSLQNTILPAKISAEKMLKTLRFV